MKTIQTKSGEVLLVKVPEDCKYNIGISVTNKVFGNTNNSIKWESFSTQLPEGKYFEVVGEFSELKDEVFEEFVEVIVPNNNMIDTEVCYKLYDTSEWFTLSSKDSFQSLCKSQGIEDDLSNYLIIKKL